MNYTTLSLKELIHYGELDAKTPLELALVAALTKKSEPTDVGKLVRRLRDDMDSAYSYLEQIEAEVDNGPQ
jgi:hypothetical protein